MLTSASLLLRLLQFCRMWAAKRRTGLSVKCDVLQAQPCQLWGTEVWPQRCLASPVASGPDSQLHNTAYPEQCHLLNNRPKTKRKHISEQFVPTVRPHIPAAVTLMPRKDMHMWNIYKGQRQFKIIGDFEHQYLKSSFPQAFLKNILKKS